MQSDEIVSETHKANVDNMIHIIVVNNMRELQCFADVTCLGFIIYIFIFPLFVMKIGQSFNKSVDKIFPL